MTRWRRDERGCLTLGLAAVLALAVAGWLIARRASEEAHRWSAGRRTAEIAALRPPPMPPDCSSIDASSPLRLRGGELADVRIFRFDTTIYYVPSEWLGFDRWPAEHLVRGVAPNDLGLLDPDLHPVECPGVVHRVTNAGLYLADQTGVGLGQRVDPARPPPGDGTGAVFAQKRRRTGDNIHERAIASLAADGLVESRNRQWLDAWIPVASDIALRITWHPEKVTHLQWQDAWSKPEADRVDQAAIVRGAEFRQLSGSARRLHAWLTTPPSRRGGVPPSLAIGDRRTTPVVTPRPASSGVARQARAPVLARARA